MAPPSHARTDRRRAIDQKLKIVADERVAALDSTFGRHGEVIKLDGGAIRREHLLDADALVTRTVTRVDQSLLQDTPVRFVGTATIGFDHLDCSYLDQAGIRWASAPGCNADATAQYTLAIYLLACERLGLDPRVLSYGVVGRGNVGSRLMLLLEALGVNAIACDPPLGSAGETGLFDLGDILDCEAISLHVPLTRHGQWPTHHMFNSETFSSVSANTLLINTARGDVVDGQALKSWMAEGGQAALDVWPGEPEIDGEMLSRTVVASPHVAGYSVDGKQRASAMVYRAFCRCFGVREHGDIEITSDPAEPRLRGEELARSVLGATPIERDDRAIRGLLEAPRKERTRGFKALRSNYPLRRDLVL